MTIAADVLAFSCPSCPACEGTASPCVNGCDTLPALVTVRPEGQGDTFTWLANGDQLMVAVAALGDTDARIVIGSDEIDALYPSWLVAAYEAQTDVTPLQED